MIKLQELIEKISSENNIPKGQVRKIAKLFSDEIIEAIESNEGIATPHLIAVTRTIPAKEAKGESPYRPERKVLNVNIKPKKDVVGSDSAS